MTESLLLPSLKIKNYRVFDDLEVSTLGRVNLIVGQNNVGKTSLLEAIWLWASRGDYPLIERLVDQRDGASVVTQQIEFSVSPDERRYLLRKINTLLGITSLFSGFPAVEEERPPIVISSSGAKLFLKYQIQKKHLPLLKDSEYFELDFIPALTVSFGRQEIYQTRVNRAGRLIIRELWDKKELWDNDESLQSSRFHIPLTHFLSARNVFSSSIKKLWDNSLMNSRTNDVLRGLTIIDNNVSEIFFVDDHPPVAVCRHSQFSRPIPLRILGDGVIRIFHILLALVNSQNGILLIDEFENGLHYTIQPKAWEVIFQMAERLNVQVFATTHSADAVRAFEQVAMQQNENDEKSGVIVQLARFSKGIIANPLFGDDIRLMYYSEEDLR